MTSYSVDFVIQLALILLLSILPSIVYLAIWYRANKRWQTRLRRAQIRTTCHSRQTVHEEDYGNCQGFLSLSDRRRTVDKYYIGDTTCKNNARSPYIRCAINPSGPCQDCSHYENSIIKSN